MTEDSIKAKLNTAYGEVELQGSPQAIKEVLSGLGVKGAKKSRKKKTIKMAIMDLITSNFLEYPRTLTEIREELAKRGYTLPEGSLTPILLRDFVQPEYIDRAGTKKSYLYTTNPKKVPIIKQQVCEIHD
jgi:hypothetical protein